MTTLSSSSCLHIFISGVFISDSTASSTTYRDIFNRRKVWNLHGHLLDVVGRRRELCPENRLGPGNNALNAAAAQAGSVGILHHEVLLLAHGINQVNAINTATLGLMEVKIGSEALARLIGHHQFQGDCVRAPLEFLHGDGYSREFTLRRGQRIRTRSTGTRCWGWLRLWWGLRARVFVLGTTKRRHADEHQHSVAHPDNFHLQHP